jgi:ribonuclease HII
MSADAERKRRNARERERRRLQRLHRYEDAARAAGHRFIAGTDEVGRGPLAGPVVAAVVVLDGPLMLTGLDDSKKVRPELRVQLAERIRERCAGWAIGEASVEEIDRLNIYWASVLAMERAIAGVETQIDYLLTDAVRLKAFAGPQEPVIKGDAKCASVAAASILAKVHRDALLAALDAVHPAYGFAEHKGYATQRHIEALEAHGPVTAGFFIVNRRATVGREGEDAAVRLLEESGYIVIARNVRLPGGEIDVIARERDVIAFVEVKARGSRRYGSALGAVDARKRRTYRDLAADWLQIAAPRARARFDVVTVENDRVTLVRGAF